jgi:hypothetical protein
MGFAGLGIATGIGQLCLGVLAQQLVHLIPPIGSTSHQGAIDQVAQDGRVNVCHGICHLTVETTDEYAESAEGLPTALAE